MASYKYEVVGPFDRRHANAYAGERAGAVCNRDGVDLVQGYTAVGEQVLRHGQQRARVRQAAILERLCDQPLILNERDGRADR